MGGVQAVKNAWNEWGLQALVLLSFTLQVALLILAEFRRRVDSGVLRLFVWSAYMLADGTAIYVLGHMSVISRSPEHQLIAFWAPFLLLHLGGQDNITAYAIEDNRLWLRHLQTLAVQVAAAGYVLYESSIVGSHSLLHWATIVMFVVGVVKYAERVWALKCAGSSPMGKNYRTFEPSAVIGQCGYYLDDKIISTCPWDTEAYLLMAHRMMDVPMKLLMGPQGKDNIAYPFASNMGGEDLYKVVEMQLSLMHDVFYTKMVVMHTNLYGLCIRILLPVATAMAFFLFHLQILRDHRKDSGYYRRLDVAVTYVLLVGAVILETVSLLRSLFSTWTCPLLTRWSREMYGRKDNTACNYLGHLVTSVRRLVHSAYWRRRYWSGSIGQHNLFELGVRSRASTISKIARCMGVEDWWNTLAYSRSIPVSAVIEEMLVNKVLRGEGFCDRSVAKGGPRKEEEEDVEEEEQKISVEHSKALPNLMGEKEEEEEKVEEEEEKEISVEHFKTVTDLISEKEEEDEEEEGGGGRGRRPETDPQLFDSLGRTQLEIWRLYKSDHLTWSIEERILVWHITTNIYLSWWYRKHNKQPKPKTEVEVAGAVDALSNYMMFLLAARHHMLSPTASRNGYVEVCYGFTAGGLRYTSADELVTILRSYGDAPTGKSMYLLRKHGSHIDFTTQHHLEAILLTGSKLGAKLIDKDKGSDAGEVDSLDVIANIWVETLCYAAQQCSADSHAKRLSNGGELITIAALLVKYLTKNHFPEIGIWFNPQEWRRGGPFGSPLQKKKKMSFWFEREDSLPQEATQDALSSEADSLS